STRTGSTARRWTGTTGIWDRSADELASRAAGGMGEGTGRAAAGLRAPATTARRGYLAQATPRGPRCGAADRGVSVPCTRRGTTADAGRRLPAGETWL